MKDRFNFQPGPNKHPAAQSYNTASFLKGDRIHDAEVRVLRGWADDILINLVHRKIGDVFNKWRDAGRMRKVNSAMEYVLNLQGEIGLFRLISEIGTSTGRKAEGLSDTFFQLVTRIFNACILRTSDTIVQGGSRLQY